MRSHILFVCALGMMYVLPVQAQRHIDLSVTALYKPTYINNGQASQAVFTIKNNGPDTIRTQDSIILFFVFNSMESNLILRKTPSALAQGDTFMITINTGVLPSVSTGGTYQFCINASILNQSAPDSVITETTTLSDNQKCRSIYVSGLGISRQSPPEPLHMVLYPNPASGYITLAMDKPISPVLGITISDTQGRDVKLYPAEALRSGALSYDMDVSDLAPGLYYCNIALENGKVVDKFIVSK